MKEDFLHYIWQHQYFRKNDLQTNQGEPIGVIHPGFHNTDAGPDFLQAQVKLGAVTWHGSVEIHLQSSDWLRHHHQTDARYDQVVLHVVWQNDQPLQRTDGTPIPTLELKDRVDARLIQGYEALWLAEAVIPCAAFLPNLPDLPRLQMLDRVLVERLDQKTQVILHRLGMNQQDWEETTYQLLCSNFGFKVNQEPFLHLSRVLPFSLLRKNCYNLLHLEALLFGQAGFLEKEIPGDKYLKLLQQEYRFLQHKYKLEAGLKASGWNFLRLRPANFPTVRLAQLASLLHKKDHLFSELISLTGFPAFRNFLSGNTSAYWQFHYLPGKPTKSKTGHLGQSSQENILINTVVPLLFAYSRYLDNQVLMDRALHLLELIPGEVNRVTQVFKTLNQPNATAADSQAYLQLYRQYCLPRKCLSCSIGHSLLQSHLKSDGPVLSTA